jgi:hypothetical protein
VGRITLQIDGRHIRSFTNQSFPSHLRGVIDWRGAAAISYGRHRLEVLAVDKIHNISHAYVTIYHVRRGH